MDMVDITAGLLDKIRAASPLVHNITNFVVMNATANILLALGASPVMAHAPEEVAEMAGLADALVLNIGTLQTDWVASMVLAGKAANQKGIPVVLDPVGAGATDFRTQTARRLMGEVKIAAIRGNASEILSLGTGGIRTRGVDSALVITGDRVFDFREMAEKWRCVVAVSGPEDLVTDGRRMFRVRNGHPLMTRVTGLGCGLSAVTGAFCAVALGDPLTAVAAALGYYGVCGELAARVGTRPGGFFTAFLDALDGLARDDLQNMLRVSLVE